MALMHRRNLCEHGRTTKGARKSHAGKTQKSCLMQRLNEKLRTLYEKNLVHYIEIWSNERFLCLLWCPLKDCA